MRKWNAVLSMLILALFLAHAVVGGFQLTGLLPGGLTVMTALAYGMVALITLHTLIGIKLTADSLIAAKKAGVSYWKENRLFWTRRVSGFAVMLFVLAHVVIFLGHGSGSGYRLNLFGGVQLASQILMVAAIALHVVTNIRPLMLAVGARRFRTVLVDVLLVLSILLVLMGAAFVIYYLRWNVW